VVLNLSWKMVKTHVKTHLKTTIEKCANALKERDKQSESCCRAILRLVEEPWGKIVGTVYEGTCTETDGKSLENSCLRGTRPRRTLVLSSSSAERGRENLSLKMVHSRPARSAGRAKKKKLLQNPWKNALVCVIECLYFHLRSYKFTLCDSRTI